VSPQRRTPPDPLPVHEGHDWLYVLDGRLRLLLGEEDLTIEPGEAVEFTTWTPHWFGAIAGAVELIRSSGPKASGCICTLELDCRRREGEPRGHFWDAR
jgi:hypothetical protein